VDHLTNYELLDLLATYSSASGDHFMNFMAIFSAYVVAGYLVATRLSVAALAFLSVLYVAVVLVIAIGNYTALAIASDLAREASSRSISLGPDTSIVTNLLAAPSAGLMKYSNASLQLSGCIGSLWFVASLRRKSDEEK
jgi:hypothetical protein